jgi:hypothetical protein
MGKPVKYYRVSSTGDLKPTSQTRYLSCFTLGLCFLFTPNRSPGEPPGPGNGPTGAVADFDRDLSLNSCPTEVEKERARLSQQVRALTEFGLEKAMTMLTDERYYPQSLIFTGFGEPDLAKHLDVVLGSRLFSRVREIAQEVSVPERRKRVEAAFDHCYRQYEIRLAQAVTSFKLITMPRNTIPEPGNSIIGKKWGLIACLLLASASGDLRFVHDKLRTLKDFRADHIAMLRRELVNGTVDPDFAEKIFGISAYFDADIFKGFIGQDCGEGPKGGLQLEPQS